MSKLTIDENEFINGGGRVNLTSTITNLKKTITPEEFYRQYAKKQNHEIFTSAGLNEFCKSMTNKLSEIDSDIEKGGCDESEKKKLEKAYMSELMSLEIVRVEDKEGNVKPYFVRKKQNAEDIEKAFDSYVLANNNKIIFKKTGKEIKSKLKDIEVLLELRRKEITGRIKELKDNFTTQPTEPIPNWYENADELSGYKVFHYAALDMAKEGTAVSVYSEAAKTNVSPSSDEEEAKMRREWNDLLYRLNKVLNDVITFETFRDNLNDKETYELNLNEIKNLGF